LSFKKLEATVTDFLLALILVFLACFVDFKFYTLWKRQRKLPYFTGCFPGSKRTLTGIIKKRTRKGNKP